MPKKKYKDMNLRKSSLDIIEKANEIIEEYQQQGYDLTLRQLYYQFVSRAYIENKQSEYKRLGSIVGDGRLAGLIDWEAITDRTRNLHTRPHWDSPWDTVAACAGQFSVDKWSNQEFRPEVWIEKDALVGVLQVACEPLDVPYFSCRGYTSLSELWAAAQRLRGYSADGKTPIVIHLGDHDPSGIDMSRDIRDRLGMFRARIGFTRIALNRDQIDRYNPPPNPAKETDARFADYQEEYGNESWELDALDPATLSDLIRKAVAEYRDDDKWSQKEEEEEQGRETLRMAVTRWGEIEAWSKEE